MMEDPNDWDWGPPKSEHESWRCHRRDELLSVSTTILMGRMRIKAAAGDEWKADADAEAKDIDDAVRIASRLVARVDGEIPRG